MKKGNLSMLVVVIFFLLGTLVLFMGVSPFIKLFYSKGEMETCRWSVTISHYLKFAGESVFDIDCPPEELELGEEELYDSGTLSHDKVKRAVAEEMRWCWYKMGEGNLEPFSEDYITRNRVCVVCSEIDFEQGELEGDTQVENFDDYLENEHLKDYKSAVTYSQYMSKEVNGRDWRLFWGAIDIGDPTNPTLRTDNNIYVDKDYLVVYRLITKPAEESVPLIRSLAGVFSERSAVPLVTIIPREDFHTLRCEDVYR